MPAILNAILISTMFYPKALCNFHCVHQYISVRVYELDLVVIFIFL